VVVLLLLLLLLFLLLHGAHHCVQPISAAASACGGSKRKMCSRSTASSFSMPMILLRKLRDGGSVLTRSRQKHQLELLR
jgi:hypothetical protein